MHAPFDEDLITQVLTGIPWQYRSWEPDGVAVVLGRGNAIATEVHEQRCRDDQIPIWRRRGGGGAVVLSPGMLVISLAKQVRHQFHFKEYFWQINTGLIEALHTLGIQELVQQGHSDICLCDRKILGASMYRQKFLLFYTAALMISNDLELIDRYLQHPSQEPEYRRGRPHRDFLTTVQREYPHITIDIVKNAIDTVFPKRIPDIE